MPNQEKQTKNPNHTLNGRQYYSLFLLPLAPLPSWHSMVLVWGRWNSVPNALPWVRGCRTDLICNIPNFPGDSLEDWSLSYLTQISGKKMQQPLVVKAAMVLETCRQPGQEIIYMETYSRPCKSLRRSWSEVRLFGKLRHSKGALYRGIEKVTHKSQSQETCFGKTLNFTSGDS